MSEAMRSPLYRNLFKVLDRDGDGKVFEKEVLAYLDAYQELQAAARLAVPRSASPRRARACSRCSTPTATAG